MVETEVASLITPWLTPTSLFVLLNIVLATIFLANNHHNSKENHHTSSNTNTYQDDGASLVPPPPQLVRAPSLFSRVASFNFSNYYADTHADAADPPPTVTFTRAPSLLYRVTSFNFGRAPQQAVEDECKKVNEEETKKSEDEVETKVVKVKKKKVNKKVKKEVVEEVKETASFGTEGEVDSKADDFINKFKQQLKMQRLESLLRYRNNSTPT